MMVSNFGHLVSSPWGTPNWAIQALRVLLLAGLGRLKQVWSRVLVSSDTSNVLGFPAASVSRPSSSESESRSSSSSADLRRFAGGGSFATEASLSTVAVSALIRLANSEEEEGPAPLSGWFSEGET